MTVPETVCQECENGLEHCHDVLVLHLDGYVQCLEPTCESGRDAHEVVASCMELDWPCDCQRVGHSQPLAA